MRSPRLDPSGVPHAQAQATQALEAGLEFLEALQLADGSFPTVRWRVVGGEEVEHYFEERTFFTTVFIGSVLQSVPGAETIVDRVTKFVEAHREPDWVWGYLTKQDPGAAALAPDVDDTALSAVLLAKAGHSVRAAEAVIVSNQDRRGRFYTWISVLGAWWRPARIRIILRRLPDLPRVFAGFTFGPQRVRDLDAGVNANVVLHFGRTPDTERALEYVIDTARRGAISDRWYEDPFMLWYLISRSLHRHRIGAGSVLLEHLAASRPTTPLQIAQAMCIAKDWGAPVPEEWITALLASQSPEGGWERTALYSAVDLRWGGQATTTAQCVEALSRWLAAPR